MCGGRCIRSFVWHLGGWTSEWTRFYWLGSILEYVARRSKSIQSAFGHVTWVWIIDGKYHWSTVRFGYFDWTASGGDSIDWHQRRICVVELLRIVGQTRQFPILGRNLHDHIEHNGIVWIGQHFRSITNDLSSEWNCICMTWIWQPTLLMFIYSIRNRFRPICTSDSSWCLALCYLTPKWLWKNVVLVQPIASNTQWTCSSTWFRCSVVFSSFSHKR